MLSSARSARRAVVCAIGIGAIAGAMLFGAAATATAEPQATPSSTAVHGRRNGARDVRRHVCDTSNYLTLHPNVNDFFTSLKGQPRDQIRFQVQTYLDAESPSRDELETIRQPSVDFRQRCGVPQTP